MNEVQWTDVVTAIGSILTPGVVVVLAVIFSRIQTRNDELLKARIQYYKELAPDLNVLMCYMTFIGRWRDMSPEEAVETKRRLDSKFFCASPLFSDSVREAYTNMMDMYFLTFNDWGDDAKILSSGFRRRQAWRHEIPWRSSWDGMFTKEDTDVISAQELWDLRGRYDRLIASIVRDLDLTRARAEYTTNLVSLNAHRPQRDPISGPNVSRSHTASGE